MEGKVSAFKTHFPIEADGVRCDLCFLDMIVDGNLYIAFKGLWLSWNKLKKYNKQNELICNKITFIYENYLKGLQPLLKTIFNMSIEVGFCFSFNTHDQYVCKSFGAGISI